MHQRVQIIASIMAGTLSYLLGQVMPYIPTKSIGSLLYTYILYVLQFTLFFSLIAKTKKTTLRHLFLFGMLFSIIDFTIFKSVFSGILGADIAFWGIYGGIAIFEMLVFVFFIHPVLSFMIPILIIEFYMYKMSGKLYSIFPNHIEIFEKNSLKDMVLLLLVVWFGGYLGGLLGGYIFYIIIPIITIIIIIYILHIILQKNIDNNKELSFKIFALSDIQNIGLVIILTIFHISGFFLFFPENIPKSVFPYIFTIVFFGLIIIALLRSFPVYKNIKKEKNIYTGKELQKYIVFAVIFPILLSIISPLAALFYLTITFICVGFGIFYFVTTMMEFLRD